MRIFTASSLHSSLKESVQSMVFRCQNAEGLTLSFPFDDACLFVVCEGETGVCAAAAFTFLWDGAFECAAFTDPAFRRKGLFSEMLEEGLKKLPEESDLYFCTDGKCPAARLTLEALEAEPDSEEYMMELSPDAAFCKADCPDENISVSESTLDSVPTLFYKSPYGAVAISDHPARFYLYGLEIDENSRGMGFGTRLLSAVLADLFSRSQKPVALQVSADNEPALRLYKKAGFRITETLSCYLY